MAQHGYLREYDEGPDRSDDRDRDWNDRDRERNWRGEDRDWNERERGFMFDRNPQRGSDLENDRGSVDRMGDRARSWFRDDDREYRGSHGDNWANRDQGSRGYGRSQSAFGRGARQQSGSGAGSDWERSPRNFSSHQDDHYLSWRDRQMDALDRDYADYCREREQQFHSDFDSWRQNRQRGSNRDAGQASDGTGEAAELELTHERALGEGGNTPSPIGDATLGTNNSENTGRGRR